jgi:hypothetical protein
MDLSKLTPAPWVSDKDGRVWLDSGCDSSLVADLNEEDDAQFCALARNAIDVMVRREWTVTKWGYGESKDKWGVTTFKGDWPHELLGMGPLANSHPDPFTALVEADSWYKANVENKTLAPM